MIAGAAWYFVGFALIALGIFVLVKLKDAFGVVCFVAAVLAIVLGNQQLDVLRAERECKRIYGTDVCIQTGPGIWRPLALIGEESGNE